MRLLDNAILNKAKSRRSAVGSALGSGPRGRGFESRRLDQNNRITIGGTIVFDFTACFVFDSLFLFIKIYTSKS